MKKLLILSLIFPLLLKKLNSSSNTANALKEFISFLSTFKHFTNFYNDMECQKELRHFHGSSHTTNAGDIILDKVLTKN